LPSPLPHLGDSFLEGVLHEDSDFPTSREF
jgi:hypothetical protein